MVPLFGEGVVSAIKFLTTYSNHESTNMKSLVFLSILALCAACVPQGLSTVAPSSTLIATPSSLSTAEPASTSGPAPTITPALFLPSPISIFDVVVDNVAISQQGQIYASGFGTMGVDIRHFAQWDGTKWIALGNGYSTAGDTLVTDGAGHLYTEIMTDSQQSLSNAIMRWDGAKWEDITGNFSVEVDLLKAGRLSSNIPVVALAVDGEDNLYAAGAFFYPSEDHTTEFPMGYVTKWDQETWTVLGKGFDKVNIFALAVNAAGEVYVAGEQPLTPEGNSNYIAQWDGEKWTRINTSMPNISLHLALDKSGLLYAAGQLNTPGGFIVSWDGTDSIIIADRLEGEAPAVFDIAVDANGHLCIGGSFESVNDTPARNIACWDGSTWHALGNGVNKQVDALAFDPSGDLYAVGFFTEAGGLSANHVARWDGETWYALGPVSNDVVVSFIIDSSDGMDDMSACLAANDIYRFVLYQDGRLIKFDGFQYVETRISQAEMDSFLSDIEATGFSSLSGDGDQYIENAAPASFPGTWGGSITVNETTITVTPGQSEYLVEPVTKTLEIIENYRPANVQPYAPESVSLWVFPEESIDLGLANPTPEPPVLNWSVDEINLNDLLTDPAGSKPKVISGEMLSFVMGQVEHTPVVRRVEQNRQNYLVVVCPNID
jgi:hypothetical protein